MEPSIQKTTIRFSPCERTSNLKRLGYSIIMLSHLNSCFPHSFPPVTHPALQDCPLSWTKNQEPSPARRRGKLEGLLKEDFISCQRPRRLSSHQLDRIPVSRSSVHFPLSLGAVQCMKHHASRVPLDCKWLNSEKRGSKSADVPAACFSRIFAATASLLRCISVPDMALPFF
jgi:hypothetical protein